MNKQTPDLNMYIFLFILYMIEIFFFFIGFFTSGLFYHYGFNLGNISIMLIIGLFLIQGITIYSLYLLSYGIIQKKKWARKFTMFFLIWASLWAMWSILIGNNIILNAIILICYIMMLFYLTSPTVVSYFSEFFKYGRYILYTRMVKLKSGIVLPIFFFSSHHPHSGIRTQLPKGYMVKENPTSHMPYLKKETQNLSKNDTTSKPSTHIKKPVIYVVNHSKNPKYLKKWACRSNQQILSQHQTKKEALKHARIIAQKKKARILVQNNHGKFIYGLKPRMK
ncbi:hypothetical protein B6U98_01715 [Thermoplasmatales archaeon ex4572_165]|nr:MAG: hypothetical protein B6U98_01715 [Thermoplasmatales archaeon ex4572_165]RLF57633.1 MAG: hypothetical protein DRN27_07395 [Thermoplasmata archaeon]